MNATFRILALLGILAAPTALATPDPVEDIVRPCVEVAPYDPEGRAEAGVHASERDARAYAGTDRTRANETGAQLTFRCMPPLVWTQ